MGAMRGEVWSAARQPEAGKPGAGVPNAGVWARKRPITPGRETDPTQPSLPWCTAPSLARVIRDRRTGFRSRRACTLGNNNPKNPHTCDGPRPGLASRSRA
ncbi:hypothetical protein Srufu_037730 [Streptomyces libani subsp. rufus]|nr:hypothetical protein Srufu_037730 [Streptomyces libani subsp. rufus]